MHILYLHQYFGTPEMPRSNRSYEIAKRFVSAGHTVTLIAGTNDPVLGKKHRLKPQIIEGIRVHWIYTHYENEFSYAQRKRAFLKFALKASFTIPRLGISPDLVYASSTPLTIGIPGILAKHLFRAPLVFEVRDLWPDAPIQMGALESNFSRLAARFLERLSYKQAHHIVALTPGMRRGILAQNVPEHKISISSNASDIDIFHNPISLSQNIPKLKKDSFKFLFAGSVSPVADLELLIEAAHRLKAASRPIEILIAGGGKSLDSLQQRALGLDNVHFLGELPRAQIPAISKLADASLVLFRNLPVLQTVSPSKFFDALAAGKPVITNLSGWIANIVKSQNCGLCANPGCPQSLAYMMEEMAKLPPYAIQYMGHNARQLAEKHFSRDKLTQKLRTTLEEIVQAS